MKILHNRIVPPLSLLVSGRKTMGQLMRLWYLSHKRPAKAQTSLRIPAQSRQSLRCSHTWSMEVEERFDQKSDI